MLITHEMHVVPSNLPPCCRDGKKGRVVESGEVIEVFKNHNNPLQNNLLEKNVWMMKSTSIPSPYQASLRQEFSGPYSVFRRRTGDAVLSEKRFVNSMQRYRFYKRGKYYAKDIRKHDYFD